MRVNVPCSEFILTVFGTGFRYVTHPADFCYKLPDNVSNEEGAMCEPLSVGVYACERGRVKPGNTIAIFGAGAAALLPSLRIVLCFSYGVARGAGIRERGKILREYAGFAEGWRT